MTDFMTEVTCGQEECQVTFTTKAKGVTTCPRCKSSVRFTPKAVVVVSTTATTKNTPEDTEKLLPTKYRLSALLRPYTIIIDLLVNHYDQTWYKGNKPKGNKALILFDNISRLSKILNIERRYFPDEVLT